MLREVAARRSARLRIEGEVQVQACINGQSLLILGYPSETCIRDCRITWLLRAFLAATLRPEAWASFVRMPDRGPIAILPRAIWATQILMRPLEGTVPICL